MPMKELLYKFQPLQLYIILAITLIYFLVQLILSHITHSLTLLVNSYHMLCNIIALLGCILTIKHSRQFTELKSKAVDKDDNSQFTEIALSNDVKNDQSQQERKLKNTFGWTRIDVLSMLIVCIFLASLCFSLLVEAIQTLIHSDHDDSHAMHLPIYVLITGCFGLLLNGLCYLLIGGYTFHQGSFLHITNNGDVVLDRVHCSGDSLKQGDRRLSRTKKSRPPLQQSRRQNFIECLRDVCSTIFVIICSIVVYFADDEQVSKYFDPLISIVSCILLLALSFPYMKESCLILLQTIPDSIDIDLFKKELMTSFSDIVNVHDLHIWQLTGNKYVSTAHIIFQNPLVFSQKMEDLIRFFNEQGINIVTIQPEFVTCPNFTTNKNCLVVGSCVGSSCMEKHCCNQSILDCDKTINSDKIELQAINLLETENCCNDKKIEENKLENTQKVLNEQKDENLDEKQLDENDIKTKSSVNLNISSSKNASIEENISSFVKECDQPNSDTVINSSNIECNKSENVINNIKNTLDESL